MERCDILGVPVDILTQQDAIRRVTEFCRRAGQFHIATPNPEMLVEAAKNEKFRNVLRKTALNVPDGAGLVWAVKRAMFSSSERVAASESRSILMGPLLDSAPAVAGASLEVNMPHRVTGTDLLQTIASPESRLCPPERIFLLGAAEGIAEHAAEALMKRNPAIKEIGTWSGSPHAEDETEIIRRINAFSPTLLFVAFGAPKQDLWIARNLAKMPSVKIAMGVGGALDFLAGKRKRAPQWMRSCGIEWLWRLILEPRRIRRIWNAVAVFPWLCLREQRTSFPFDRHHENKAIMGSDKYGDASALQSQPNNEVVDGGLFLAGINPSECRLKPAAIAQTIHLVCTPHGRDKAFRNPEHAEAMLHILDSICKRHDILIQEACVMPDHVHMLLCFARGRDVSCDVIRKIKGGSAYAFLQFIGDDSGTLWGRKYSFTYVDTDKQFERTIDYIRSNPPKEGISPSGRVFSMRTPKRHSPQGV